MDFLKQAFTGLNDSWRYVAGIMLVIIGYGFIGQIPLLSVMGLGVNLGQISPSDLANFNKTNNFSYLHISSNVGFVLMISFFIFAALGLYLAVKLHKKNVLDIITVRRPFDWKRFFFATSLWFAFTLLVEFVLYMFDKENYRATFNWSAFLPLVLISILLLPIQTAVEEIFFRGYILQGVYSTSKSPMWAILISTLFFSMVHSLNPEIEKFGFFTMQVYYITAGLFLAFVCYLDNGLELGIGIHTATNIFGATCVTYEGAVLQTETLYKMKETNPWLMILSFLLAASFFLILAGRKYGWEMEKRV